MKQPVLIDFVISAVGLDNGMAKGKYTPDRYLPLANNEYGVPISVSFKYSSIVGILFYLFSHTRPEISFGANCYARYMFSPKHLYEEALKQISWYLKLTRYRGLILIPNRELFNIDSAPDTIFSGTHGHENTTDTACVKSHTSYVITFSDCPIL